MTTSSFSIHLLFISISHNGNTEMELIELDKTHKGYHREELEIPFAGLSLRFTSGRPFWAKAGTGAGRPASDVISTERFVEWMNDKDSATGPRIAIVDDDPGMRRLLARVLRLRGFSTVTFGSGEAFLQELDSDPPVCVLLDLSMPGISGFDVKDRLAKSHPKVPVVLITGDTDPTVGIIAQQKGFAACLVKPLDPPMLLLAIRRALQIT